MGGHRVCRLLAAILFLADLLCGVAVRADDVHDPSYIRGYAAAILEREFDIQGARLELRDGVLHVWMGQVANGTQPDTIVRALLEIEGVDAVRIHESGAQAKGKPAPGEGAASQPAGTAPLDFLPAGELFAMLRADPRWPRFSVSYQWYLHDRELGHVGAVDIGESFPLIRFRLAPERAVEFGLQAGIFSVFDLDAPSSDLVNTDFLGAVFGTLRVGRLAAMLRVHHQSSHLGDEYLLRNQVTRLDLSYEAADLLLSYDLASWLRLYGGGGALVHRTPALDRGLLQTGAELESPVALAHGWLRPFASLDVQLREETNWDTDLSLQWGVQVEHPRLRRTKLRLVGEYYDGRSPNGQFFDRRIENLGFGLVVDF